LLQVLLNNYTSRLPGDQYTVLRALFRTGKLAGPPALAVEGQLAGSALGKTAALSWKTGRDMLQRQQSSRVTGVTPANRS
jgi:hypothetical protein